MTIAITAIVMLVTGQVRFQELAEGLHHLIAVSIALVLVVPGTLVLSAVRPRLAPVPATDRPHSGDLYRPSPWLNSLTQRTGKPCQQVSLPAALARLERGSRRIRLAGPPVRRRNRVRWRSPRRAGCTPQYPRRRVRSLLGPGALPGAHRSW